MKKLIFLLLIWMPASLCLHAQENYRQANEYYADKQYGKALKLYEKIVKEKGESPTLYFNIGNCYFRLNHVGKAVLYYERTLLFDPGNHKARFNLGLTKVKTVDRINPADNFFFTHWVRSVQNFFSSEQWSRLSILLFLLFLGGLSLFFFARKIILQKTGFYSAIVLLFLLVLSNLFAYRQGREILLRNKAIIMSGTVAVKNTPSEGGNDVFVLHEGTKVLVKEKSGTWDKIESDDGNDGWVKTKDIEII